MIHAKTTERVQQKIQELRKSKKSLRARESVEAREAIMNEGEAAIEQVLTQDQRGRLDQIQLQVQNAMAFERPDIQKKLELSQEQIERIKKITTEGSDEILKAAEVAVAVKPKEGKESVDMDDIRAYVKTAEFAESLRESRQRVRLARVAMMDRVRAVLSDRQNDAYRQMLGEPFEIPMLGAPDDDVEWLTRRVGAATGRRWRAAGRPEFRRERCQACVQQDPPQGLA